MLIIKNTYFHPRPLAPPSLNSILTASFQEHHSQSMLINKATYFDVRPLAPLSLARSEWLLLAGPGKSPLRARTLLRCFIFLCFVLFRVLVFILAWTDKSLFCVRIILIRQLSGESAWEDFVIVGKTPTRRGHVRAIFQVCRANFCQWICVFFCIHI